MVRAGSGNDAPTLTQAGLHSEEEEREVPLRRRSTPRCHLWLNINMMLLQNESHTHTHWNRLSGKYLQLSERGKWCDSLRKHQRRTGEFWISGTGGARQSCTHLFSPALFISVVLLVLLCVLAAFFPSSSISLISSSTCSTETYPSGSETAMDRNGRRTTVFTVNNHFLVRFALLMRITLK